MLRHGADPRRDPGCAALWRIGPDGRRSGLSLERGRMHISGAHVALSRGGVGLTRWQPAPAPDAGYPRRPVRLHGATGDIRIGGALGMVPHTRASGPLE